MTKIIFCHIYIKTINKLIINEKNNIWIIIID